MAAEPEDFSGDEAELDAALDSFLDWAGEHEAVTDLEDLLNSAVGEDSDASATRTASVTSRLLRRHVDPEAREERYEVQGEIARGGQGAVLKVWDRELRRTLAMKVVLGRGGRVARGASPDVDESRLARFLEEAQITGQLNHPGIVPVHEVGVDEAGRIYFTMRLVNGRPLKEIFKRVATGEQGWTRTRALGALLRVCETVAYAHDKGVLHRDLKPSNVMVGRYGEVYVMDWGLARILGAEARGERSPEDTAPGVRTDRADASESGTDGLLTADGAVVGTPFYMPPEQAEGRLEDLGPTADVYAVGAMLYHLLTGSMPYAEEVHTTTRRTLDRVIAGPPRPLESLAPDVPPELAAICTTAMAREPGDRYEDMGALARDLSAYLEGRVVSVHETGALAEAKKWIQRNRALAGALGAAVVLLFTALFVSVRSTVVAKEKNVELSLRSAYPILRQLVERADDLWPATPKLVPQYELWLEQVTELADDRERFEAELALLRERALPYTDEDRARDRETHPMLAQLQREVAWLAEGEAQRDAKADRDGKTPEEMTEFNALLAAQREKIAGLEALVSSRRTWEFEDETDEWREEMLAKLLEGLDAISDPETGLLDGASPEHGLGIRPRLEFASTVLERSIESPEARAAWERAVASVASVHLCPRYDGLVIEPQLGLLPLGRDEGSGLWEFCDLISGEPPARDETGRLILTEETGLVLVLLPSATFVMGASNDPEADNYDELAANSVYSNHEEHPPHEVQLDAFFVSKFEMTQAQWQRLSGHNPSGHQPADPFPYPPLPTLLHPVERVSWHDCASTLERIEMLLPTEAQWEYAARGEVRGRWASGPDPRELEGTANLANRAYSQMGVSNEPRGYVEWDDGFPYHAPVGSFRPNGFGLHDVHGNVWEWCLDGVGTYNYGVTPGDGRRIGPSKLSRMRRGGSFHYPANYVRLTHRSSQQPSSMVAEVGVRPVRKLVR